MRSLSVVFPRKNVVDAVEEELANEPGPGEVLLQCSKTLISTGTELSCLAGQFESGSHWDQWVQYPFRPGYSWTGEVVAVGAEAEGFAMGDRMALQRTHQQYIVARPEELRPPSMRIPDGVTDEEAAWMVIARVVDNAIRRAEIHLGESVVIIGLGALGQLAVQYARLCGARDLIAIDPSEKRLAMASEHGATHLLAAMVEEEQIDQLARKVKDITGTGGADVVIDVTGAPSVLAPALSLCRKFGRFVLLGDPVMPGKMHLTHKLMTQGLTVAAAHGGHPPAIGTEHHRWGAAEIHAFFLEMLVQRRINVKDLITHRFRASDARQAYEMLRRNRTDAVGVILDFTEA